MKILFRHTRVFTFLLTLLLLGSAASEAWATKVTYHILTLPIHQEAGANFRYDYHMVSGVNGYRLEAIKVVVDQSSVQLPDQFKSPLVSTYTYYPESADIIKGNSGSALQLFTNNNKTKGFIYQIKGVDTADTPAPTPVDEGTSISGDEAEFYVIYDYNEASNTIVKLDGSVNYNIGIKGKGFLSYNRGRNNRPAVMPKAKVDAQLDVLTSEDFVKIESPGAGIGTYWNSGDNKNVKTDVESQFHFLFKFEGKDPYNIILRTAYGRDNTYIEKNDGTNDFVYKWYKEGSLLAVTTNNAFIASDDHRLYTSPWVSGSSNPTNPASEAKPGNFHGQTANAIWGSVALLNNNDRSGYLFMGTRTADNNGNLPTPSDNKYNYLKFDNNNLTFNKLTTADASKSYSTEGIYPIKTIYFHVKTPFGNTVTASIKQSAYVLQSAAIDAKDIPESLRRKYCSFTNFYSDAALTNEITKYSDAADGNIYVKYEVSDAAPFKAIAPSASYTTATWYELTDEGSTQESGRKIKWNDGSPGTYKNNGANGEYVKESEFAFEGDPYELKVLYRKGSEATESNTYVTLSSHYTWDIPNDATDGSFLLRKFNDTGYWNWNTEHTSVDVSYGSTASPSVGKDAQTITLNVSGLDGHKYFKITTDGTGVGQIESVTPAVGSVYAETSTSQTVTVKLKANTSVADKTMTITIQEYNDEEGKTASGTASVVTITQGTTSSFAGNEVGYSPTSSTRVKVLELPKFNFTYNIVDKSGRIAVKASAEQDIYTPLTLASIPSIIVSPFLVGEDVTFYLSFNNGSGPGTGTSRTHLSDPRTETPNAPTNIYVKYTTGHLNDKPIKLSEDQEFYVKLNGRYLYYDSGTHSILTNSEYTSENKYKWKLRNRDPYNMLIDNIGARTDLIVSGDENVTVYDDNGGTTTESRQMGAWVDLASIVNQGALSFTNDRATAQQFIAKSGTQGGVYEVMVANGEDASTTYYNIGCPENNTVNVYSNAKEGGYSHGDDVLRFVLESENAYTYHLIDKSKKILLEIASKSPDLMLPADYQSPLVATYHYYDIDQFTVTNGVYTLNGGAIELTNLSSLDATIGEPESSTVGAFDGADSGHKHSDAISTEDIKTKAKKLKTTGNHFYKIGDTYYVINVTKAAYTDIYVTYDKNDLVTFNSTSSPYLLKFLNPYAAGYKLEDGNDHLTSDEIQAVYPYTNGDGNLNIYGERMNEEQMGGGASTRPRWLWFFESDTYDPYHVKIHSRSTISFKGINHPTYLQTYAVHFNQDTDYPNKQHVVTGGVLPGVSSIQPSEYMVLGTEGNYRLMTTYPVLADLDGDGNTTGNGENQRQVVNAFEQYWKTYNMVKLDVLKISDPDAYSTDESTWVVPDNKREELKTKQPDWHSYDAFANAVRWNGYNDKSDGHTKKVVEKLEHWFQTFEMGNGAFDIISADIPPVLVLLDRHGWEIMRKPLPKSSTYPYGEELDALRAYDSPMVKEYKFYSNATKASGCHKYTLRLDDDKKERDQITVGDEQYTSTSLAALPPRTAKGVISSGAFNDFYVTYTVKNEYEKSYRYHLDESNYSEAGSKASKYVMLCDGRYIRDIVGTADKYHNSYFSKPIYEGSNPTGGNIYDMILSPTKTKVGNVEVDANGDGFVDDICLWYIQPNLNIDEEMGIKWGTADTGNEPLTQNATKLAYKDKTGFDPYNIQLKNASDSKYFTTHMTSAKLSNGSMVGDYSGTDYYGNAGSIYITREDQFNNYTPNVAKRSEGYDHTNLQISNQTFMAVQDAKGNMQLMPRFDHTKRVNIAKYDPFVTTVADPVDHEVATIADNESMGVQTVFFVRPQANIYHIIDNDGYEALTYRAGGEWNPIVPDGAKSPLAKDFKFYLTASYNSETNKYTIDESSEIKESIVGVLPDDKLYTTNIDIYVRYSYDEDNDEEKILQGRWFTAQLANKDLQASGTVVTKDNPSTDEKEVEGTGVSLYTGTKPGGIGEEQKVWQWKFLAAPMDPSSSYYVAPDPYSVKVYNRNANYSNDTSVEPNPMKIGIKVPNADNGANRFALLSHPNGGHAFAVAQTYDSPYEYSYINGADMTDMTTPSTTAASTKTEGDAIRKEANDDSDYDTKKAALSDGTYYFRIHGEAGIGTPLYRRVYRFKKVTVSGSSRTEEDCTRTEWEDARSEGIKVVLNNDVNHTYRYHVITNGGSDYIVDNPGSLAISATQTKDEASSYNFEPHLPVEAQTTLLNMEDYLYFGSAEKQDNVLVGNPSDDTYKVVLATKLISLEGLYDDVVYVRYSPYDVNKTPYKVPNVRNALNTGNVGIDSKSKDAAINITGNLPYNIIWYNDNMMQSTDNSTISDGGSQDLGGGEYVWQFWGNDPYALNIKHKASGKYVDGTGTLSASPKNFMLLKKEDYDYGVLQETGGTNMLSGYGNTTVSSAPTHFIIFGLSVHDLIYRLVIAKTCANHASPSSGEYVDIPYRTGGETTYTTSSTLKDTDIKRIYGTTQRDLTNSNYQLGAALSWGDPSVSYTYCHDAGKVTVGDALEVPSVFKRPNCLYFYYVDGIYSDAARTSPVDALNNKYKGLELTRLPKDDALVGTSVVVNVAYAFQTGLETNAGEGFVTSVGQNLWYTFQTTETTPYLAQYTKAWGLQAMEGRETRYTNDYLWTPVGDVYGFKMYNRYMYKNIPDGTSNVMTKANINDAGLLDVATYGDNDVFELLDVPNTPGAFRVHPVANYTGTQYYIYKDASDGNKVKLSTNYTGWTFGLGTDLLKPYIDRKGYVGGLTSTAYTTKKEVLDKVTNGTAGYADLRTVQSIVYNDANIVKYAPGYYRLHSQPGIGGMPTVRYASGYLHDIEKTAGHNEAGIPMHLYSREGVSTTFAGDGGLGSGFTISNATRGDIPIDPTEYDPSTIFYFQGAAAASNPTSTISTQELYVVANNYGDTHNGTTSDENSRKQRAAMATSGGINFTIMDIGGAIVLIHDGADASVRRYLNYDQDEDANIYDLKYYHNANTEEARWCMQPVQKNATAGDGEMPLMIRTNNGGDNYYYTTFYAPFDVLLTDVAATADTPAKTYQAFYCKEWNDNGLHPTMVPATNSYAKGKFIPAGTPVIIRTDDESGSIKVTLPNNSPSSKISSNIFSGEYLEKLLSLDASHDVYTLGLPFISNVEKDPVDYNTTGDIIAPLPEQATSDLGFYINATPDKESSQTQSLWARNNRYVLHNKIYYRATGGGAGTRGVEFVPVLFEAAATDVQGVKDYSEGMLRPGNVYNLQGRCVATEEMVKDGTWKNNLTPGVYIMSGKKIIVK